jgi:hypothetical protein
MNKVITPRFIFVVSAIAIAALTRVLPHPPNFTAVGAMALLAGACLSNRLLSLLIPMIALFITDLALGFHNTMWAVYGATGLTVMLGWLISKRQNFLNVTAASLASILLFFLITNSAMWVVGFFVSDGFYPQTLTGLTASIAAGIPFLDESMISQLLYTGVLFGAFHFLRVRKPELVRA